MPKLQRILIGGQAWVYDARPYLPDPDNGAVYNRPTERIRHLWLHHSAIRYGRTNVIQEQLAHLHDLWRAEQGRLGNQPVFPYNFAIFPNGRRFYTGDVDTGRPHTGDFNDDLAIVLIGNCEEDVPPDRQMASAQVLLRAVPGIWGFEEDHWPRLGHQDAWHLYGSEFGRTACPGQYAYQWLKEHYPNG